MGKGAPPKTHDVSAEKIRVELINKEKTMGLATPSEVTLQELKDNLASSFKGRTKGESVRTNKCIMCDNPNLDFRDGTSKREYSISGMCQTCQDKIFG